MDSASLTSLTPLLDGIDRWVELLPLLPVLVSLELVLSADNAVALASITKGLGNIELQKKAIGSITSNQGVYTPTNNQNDSWTMEINKQKESLDWLL